MKRKNTRFKSKKVISGIGIRTISVILIATLILAIGGCNKQTSSNESTNDAANTSTNKTSLPTESTETPLETSGTSEGGKPTEPIETAPAETESAEIQPSETMPIATKTVYEEYGATWTIVEETVYAISTVNVRSGPSAEYDKLGSLSWGNSVTRIAVGSNEWSKVIYKDQEAFISSEYLSTKKPVDNSTVSYDGLEVAKLAVEYQGLDYVYGGNSLTEGADCSGFTKLIYAQFGISLPRTAAEQSKVGTKVTLAEAKPGDLYAEEYSDKSNYTGHAGIYIGDGWMVSAWPGEGVCVTRVNEDDTFRRIGINTCTTHGEDAIKALEKHCISRGIYGSYSFVYYYGDTQTVVFSGSVFECGYFGGVPTIELNVTNVENGYELLAKVWKEAFLKKQKFSVRSSPTEKKYYDGMGNLTTETSSDPWGCLDGKWYGFNELHSMWMNNENTDVDPRRASWFYGIPWDSDSKITNGLNEEIDLSTFPKLCKVHDYQKIVIEATCQEAGHVDNVCSICEYSYEVEAVGRAECTYEAIITEPTCMYEGYTTYTCSVCGDSYTDDYYSIVDCDYQKTVTAPTCTEEGYTTYTCKMCGDSYKSNYTDATGHSYGDWAVTKEPTTQAEGEKQRTCSACGKVQSKSIDKLEAEEIDLDALVEAGLEYAVETYGYEVERGLRDGYYPPNERRFDTIEEGFYWVKKAVDSNTNQLNARGIEIVEEIDGVLCPVRIDIEIVYKDGWYYIYVYYG